MPGPRYAPRDYTEDSAAFGKTLNLRWRTVDTATEADRRGAARLQHLYVHRIRQLLKVKRMGVAEFAKEGGSSYHRMSRLLRGEIVMRLEDIAAADRVLKEVSEFGIESHRLAQEREAKAKANAEAKQASERADGVGNKISWVEQERARAEAEGRIAQRR